ncbi:MAG TPA: cytochrome c3 family protein [Candidatus Deferrimicrobiaceae bacterium]
MRKAAFWTALVVAAVFAFGTAFAAPPDKVVIKEIQKQKAPVTFTHKAHGEKVKACADCHHADKAGAEQKCAKCHGDKTDGKKLSLKEAFHTQCKGCHQKEKKGPTKCDDCHKK